jgi:hypothetical protein
MRTEALQLPAQPAMLRMYPDNWPPPPANPFLGNALRIIYLPVFLPIMLPVAL